PLQLVLRPELVRLRRLRARGFVPRARGSGDEERERGDPGLAHGAQGTRRVRTMRRPATRGRRTRMEPWKAQIAGRYDELEIDSRALEGNALGDPQIRPLWVYVPPGYDADPQRRFPSVYLIQGLTGQLDMWRNRSAFRKNPTELIDDLFARG